MVTDFPVLNNVKMFLKDINGGDYTPLCDIANVTTTIDEAEEKPGRTLSPWWNKPITMSFKCVTRMRLTKADKRKLLGWRACRPIINTRRRQIMRAKRMQYGPLPY